MADKIISDLEPIESVVGDEVMPLENGTGTFSITVNGIKDYTISHNDFKRLLAKKNLLINGDFNIAYDGSSFTATTSVPNSDDTYLFGIWNQVSDGNDIADYSQELTVKPVGAYSSLKIDIETANKQCGIVQFLEAKDAAALISGKASLSFQASKDAGNATAGTLRAAIISWKGTADTLTSDVVGTWAGAGTNPTLATNWEYENTPSDLALTSSFQEFKIEDVSIDATSAKQVAVFIWLDDTDATIGDLIYISRIKLEANTVCTPFIPRSIQEEINLIQRFYETSYNIGVAPATITGATAPLWRPTQADFHFSQTFKTAKRTDPTVVIYSPATGASGKLRDFDGAADLTALGTNTNQQCLNIYCSTNTAGRFTGAQWTANSRL